MGSLKSWKKYGKEILELNQDKGRGERLEIVGKKWEREGEESGNSGENMEGKSWKKWVWDWKCWEKSGKGMRGLKSWGKNMEREILEKTGKEQRGEAINPGEKKIGKGRDEWMEILGKIRKMDERLEIFGKKKIWIRAGMRGQKCWEK